MGRPLIACLISAAALVACGRSSRHEALGFKPGKPFPDFRDRIAALSQSKAPDLNTIRPALLKDTDNDGIIDKFDPDIDNDGVPNLADADAMNASLGTADADHDGVPDFIDFDRLPPPVVGSDDCNDVAQRNDCARLQAEIFSQASLLVTFETKIFTRQELEVIRDTLEPLKNELKDSTSWTLLRREGTLDSVRASYDADWNVLSIRPLEALRQTYPGADGSLPDGAAVYAVVLRHEFGHRFHDLHNDVFRKFLETSGWAAADPARTNDLVVRQLAVPMSFEGVSIEISGDMTHSKIPADWLAAPNPEFPSVYAKYGAVEHFAECYAADLITMDQWRGSELLQRVFPSFTEYVSPLKILR